MLLTLCSVSQYYSKEGRLPKSTDIPWGSLSFCLVHRQPHYPLKRAPFVGSLLPSHCCITVTDEYFRGSVKAGVSWSLQGGPGKWKNAIISIAVTDSGFILRASKLLHCQQICQVCKAIAVLIVIPHWRGARPREALMSKGPSVIYFLPQCYWRKYMMIVMIWATNLSCTQPSEVSMVVYNLHRQNHVLLTQGQSSSMYFLGYAIPCSCYRTETPTVWE